MSEVLVEVLVEEAEVELKSLTTRVPHRYYFFLTIASPEHYQERRLFARYIPRAVGPEGCTGIWRRADVRGN